MGHAWDTDEARMGRAWDTDEARMGHAWDTDEARMGHAWDTDEAVTWGMHGTRLGWATTDSHGSRAVMT